MSSNNSTIIKMITNVISMTDTYPILPPIFTSFCIICSIPVVILIIATRRCAVHKNCKFLLVLWAVSLQGTLIDITMISLYTLTYEDGYLHHSIESPFFRPYLLTGLSFFYAGGSVLEMFIALERILSTWRPHIYQSSGMNPIFLTLATLISYFIGLLAGYILCIKMYLTVGTVLYNVIDLTTLIINGFGIRYCEGRYRRMYAKGTLNARYQVKEAYLLAKAMHPVYLSSFAIKFLAICIGYTYILLLQYFDGLIFALIESIYLLVHAFNCAFSSAFLMKKHKSMRRAVRKMFRRNRKVRVDPVISISKEESSVTHFNILDSSWK